MEQQLPWLREDKAENPFPLVGMEHSMENPFPLAGKATSPVRNYKIRRKLVYT